MDLLILLKAALLGVVEGVTEFLPISSTAHLIIAGDLLGFTGDKAKTFEIFIQLGAILSIVWLFRKKIWQQVQALFSRSKSPEQSQAFNFWLKIFVAFLPAAIVGLLFHKWIKEVLFAVPVVAIALLLGGILIFVLEALLKDATVKTSEKITLRQALFVGCAQVLALIPGVSRSGSTIFGGMAAGFSRQLATEFSFFLAIPTMLAATLYDLAKSTSTLTSADTGIFAVGFTSAFLSALIVVKIFIRFVSTHTFRAFGWYRIVLGLTLLAWWHF